jgi:uncharacterized protein (DUF58 family)
MRWHSRQVDHDKVERAELLLLALASLLLRGGERVRLIGGGPRPVAGLDALVEQLQLLPQGSGLPPDSIIPRHARVVLIGDLLSPLADVQAVVGRMAALPVTGYLLQVLDPAEALLPYEGRIRFEGVPSAQAGAGPTLTTLIPRVEGVRDAYARRLAEQQEGLAAICAAAGWGFSVHRTDHPPEAALLALYTALAPEPGRR